MQGFLKLEVKCMEHKLNHFKGNNSGHLVSLCWTTVTWVWFQNVPPAPTPRDSHRVPHPNSEATSCPVSTATSVHRPCTHRSPVLPTAGSLPAPCPSGPRTGTIQAGTPAEGSRGPGEEKGMRSPLGPRSGAAGGQGDGGRGQGLQGALRARLCSSRAIPTPPPSRARVGGWGARGGMTPCRVGTSGCGEH